MASSRKSLRSKRAATDLVSRVAGRLREFIKPGDRLIVGLSGGVDSVVLLDLLSRIAKRRKLVLAALHVNHQISPNAGRWAAFCRTACRARGIPLRVIRVKVKGGDSLEAAARAARYEALLTQKTDYIVLAHNQDDQAETLLLQLLRGAGVKGLAAMPLVSSKRLAISGQQNSPHASRLIPFNTPLRDTPHIVRPLLDVTRREIEAYASGRKLAWVEDESNADRYFLRNFLRHEVLPLIAGRFPACNAVLARSASHMGEASQMLDELAAGDGDGYCDGSTLRVAGLRRLSRVRAKNLLRYFLSENGVMMPNAERLEEALRQALTAKDDAVVCIDLGSRELRRFAGVLHLVAKVDAAEIGFSRPWRGERELAVPELNGVLMMTRARGAGLSLARLKTKPVTIGVRSGGERLQPDCRRPRRSLKNLLQEAGVPPWLRDSLPLLFCGSTLLWAPGIGIACEFQAQAGEISVVPEWHAQ